MKQFITAVVAASCLFVSGCSVVNSKHYEPYKVDVGYKFNFEIKDDPITLYKPTIKVPVIHPTDANCLAKVMYYEAGGESILGKEAVAFVIINRTMNSKYPNTICEVVKQKVVINRKSHCQFSWYCDNGNYKLQTLIDNAVYKQCLELAMSILSGTIDNFIPKALSFHASRVQSGWTKRGMVKVAHIGNHIFYTEKS